MSEPRAEERPPNILWICTDSQRWDMLGCYGNPWIQTPNADRLAARGVRFEHAIAQNPLCMPSRGSFLTGRYPSTTGLRQNGQTCPPSLRPITADFADAGYACGLSGKFHLNAADRRFSLGPEWWSRPESEWTNGREPRIHDGYKEFHWDHAAHGDDPHSDYATWLAEHHPDATHEKPEYADCRFVRHGRPEHQRQSRWCTDLAIDFMERQAGGDRPWLFSINTFDPHYIFDPADEAMARLLPLLNQIDPPIPAPEAGTGPVPEAHRQARERFADRTQHDARMIRLAAWAMCETLDRELGRLLDALDRTGQAEDTVVVFMSDHGEMLGDHGLYIKGPYLFEQALRVPLIVMDPRPSASGSRGSVHTGVVELASVAPTLNTLAGLPAMLGVQAADLAPLLRGGAGSGDGASSALFQYHNSNPDRPPRFQTGLRTNTHKLVVHHGEATGELYNLVEDPQERHNLWLDPAAAGIQHQLTHQLLDRMAFAADPLPERIGAF